jgi:hypothetical protein
MKYIIIKDFIDKEKDIFVNKGEIYEGEELMAIDEQNRAVMLEHPKYYWVVVPLHNVELLRVNKLKQL